MHIKYVKTIVKVACLAFTINVVSAFSNANPSYYTNIKKNEKLVLVSKYGMNVKKQIALANKILIGRLKSHLLILFVDKKSLERESLNTWLLKNRVPYFLLAAHQISIGLINDGVAFPKWLLKQSHSKHLPRLYIVRKDKVALVSQASM